MTDEQITRFLQSSGITEDTKVNGVQVFSLIKGAIMFNSALLIGSLGQPENEYIIHTVGGVWYISHKHVGSREPLEQFLNS